ncbi:class I SAM-dependent methyltransferase [Solwaraspora sp. WMMB335]|uniref:class I SAM-dependent methyltransferase n=1 Tax=Solwaraspora sp. WMMB335 TaxID=3404118 RepID=UPI003B964AFB
MTKNPTVEDYAALLAVDAHEEADRQEFWDARADDYDQGQRHDDGVLADAVVAHLAERGILTNADVLDVGAGAGRYALRIARHAARVQLTDISGRMLAHARANADTATGPAALDYTRLDWSTADLDALGWRAAFDVVFASMVPVVRSREGIDRMTAASRSWCVVNRTIRMRDTIAQHIERELGVGDRYDARNDTAYPLALINYLWLRGHLPTVAYVEHHTTTRYTLDEATARYAGPFEAVPRGRTRQREGELRRIISRAAVAVAGDGDGDGAIIAENEQVTAVITWRV